MRKSSGRWSCELNVFYFKLILFGLNFVVVVLWFLFGWLVGHVMSSRFLNVVVVVVVAFVVVVEEVIRQKGNLVFGFVFREPFLRKSPRPYFPFLI